MTFVSGARASGDRIDTTVIKGMAAENAFATENSSLDQAMTFQRLDEIT